MDPASARSSIVASKQDSNCVDENFDTNNAVQSERTAANNLVEVVLWALVLKEMKLRLMLTLLKNKKPRMVLMLEKHRK